LARNGCRLVVQDGGLDTPIYHFETSDDTAEVEKALPNARFVTASTSVAAKVLHTLHGGRLQVPLNAPAFVLAKFESKDAT
jgi:hypothetical protein